MAASTPDLPETAAGPETFGLGALFARSADGLAVLDLRSASVVLWNPAAEALFGHAQAEVQGRSITALIPAALPAGASRAAFEVEGRHRAGHALALEVSLSPLERADDPGPYALAVFRDVGERKRIEAALVERTGALERALDELRQADRYKDEFLAALSHELRTPITAIMAYSEFLADGLGGPLSDAQAAFLHEIEEATQRLLARVDDVLDVARLQAGAFRLDRRPADVAAVVREAAAALGLRAAAAGVGCRLACPEAALTAEIDERQVRRALDKLAENALKFTPRGGCIELRVRRDGPWIRAEVADTGGGIRQADFPRLFDRFWQADMSSTRAQGGLGLGLPIVRAIVEGHGGAIGVDPERRDGTTFWFTLPAS